MSFPWRAIHQTDEVDDLRQVSYLRPQVIFKHSSRCNLSSVAKRRLEHFGPAKDLDFHLLDIISYRDISNRIGKLFEVWHESPQVLLIIDGECIYDDSHLSISVAEILEQASPKIKG